MSSTVPISVRPFSFKLRSISIDTTRVLISGGNTRSSGGEGSLAVKRWGLKGAATMKMIKRTSRTSIKGVTLIDGSVVVLGRVAFIGSPRLLNRGVRQREQEKVPGAGTGGVPACGLPIINARGHRA